MAIRLMSPIPARVIQVLRDFLPAELDLIDTEEGGFSAPDIPDNNYFEWDRQAVTSFPAMTIKTVSSSPGEILADGFGRRIDARHRLDLLFHATPTQSGGDALKLQQLMHRYVSGAARVLAVMKDGLQTSADNTRFAEIVEWTEPATYGPETEQEGGAVVRTATLPISVRRREVR